MGANSWSQQRLRAPGGKEGTAHTADASGNWHRMGGFEDTMMNDYAAQWFSRNEGRFHELGLTISISTSDGTGSLPKPSVKIDLDSEERLGTITCWATGETNFDVVDIESEEPVASKYFELKQQSEAQKVFEEFVELVSGQLNETSFA